MALERPLFIPGEHRLTLLVIPGEHDSRFQELRLRYDLEFFAFAHEHALPQKRNLLFSGTGVLASVGK